MWSNNAFSIYILIKITVHTPPKKPDLVEGFRIVGSKNPLSLSCVLPLPAPDSRTSVGRGVGGTWKGAEEIVGAALARREGREEGAVEGVTDGTPEGSFVG